MAARYAAALRNIFSRRVNPRISLRYRRARHAAWVLSEKSHFYPDYGSLEWSPSPERARERERIRLRLRSRARSRLQRLPGVAAKEGRTKLTFCIDGCFGTDEFVSLNTHAARRAPTPFRGF